MKLVSVGKLYTEVDEADYAEVSKHIWCLKARSDNKGHYAFRYIRIGPKKYKRETLHHFLLQPSLGEKVDHADGDGLNNQRYNLRRSTQQQNSFNQKVHVDSRTGYKGVTAVCLIHGKYTPRKPWIARIRHNSKLMTLGYYLTQREAALAYNAKAVELFGEFANLNDVQ